MTEPVDTALAAEQRLPAAYLGASYLAHGVTTLGSVAGVVVFLANPDVWPGKLAVAVFAAFLILRVIDPLYEWATTRMTITAQDFRVTSGLFNRRTRSIRWSAVHTVETTAPWAYRLFGLVRVRIAQGGDSSTQVTLAGITREFRDEILTRSPVPDSAQTAQESDATAPRPVSAGHDGPPPPDARGALVYRASAGDLVIASLLFGRFAVVAVAIAFALFEQLDNFGLLGMLDNFNGVGVVGLSVFVALAVAGLGIVSSVIRFGRLQVRINAHGAIAVSYGLIETSDRVIDSAGVTGVVLQRNALEMILGRVRLGLLTTDTSQQFGSNLLLPSLPRDTVTQILHAGFQDRVPVETLATHDGASLRVPLSPSPPSPRRSRGRFWMHGLGLPIGLAIVGSLVLWAIIATSARPFRHHPPLRPRCEACGTSHELHQGTRRLHRLAFDSSRDEHRCAKPLALCHRALLRRRATPAGVGVVLGGEPRRTPGAARRAGRARGAAWRYSRDEARQRRLSADVGS